MRGGFKSIKNRWLATYEAEQRAAEAATAASAAAKTSTESKNLVESTAAASVRPPAAGCTVGITTLPSSISQLSVPSQVKQESNAQQQPPSQIQPTNNKQTRPEKSPAQSKSGKLEPDSVPGQPELPQAGKSAIVGNGDETSHASGVSVPSSKHSDSKGQEHLLKQIRLPLLTAPGNKEAAVSFNDGRSRKRRAELLPEAVPRSQQRRGDDPPLPAPSRLAKQVASVVPDAIPSLTKLRPPVLALVPRMRGNGIGLASSPAPLSPSVLHHGKPGAVPQPGGMRSPPRQAAVCDPHVRLKEQPKMQVAVQQQRKVLQQPRGPDCAPHARPRMRPDAVVAALRSPAAKATVSKATAAKVAVTKSTSAKATAKVITAVETPEAAIKRRPDALPRGPNLTPSAVLSQKSGSRQQPTADVAASLVEASNQTDRLGRNSAVASKGSKVPEASHVTRDAHPKTSRKLHPQIPSSSHTANRTAQAGVEQLSKTLQHAKPVKQAASRSIAAQDGAQPTKADLVKAKPIKAQPVNAQPVNVHPVLPATRSGTEMQPVRDPIPSGAHSLAVKAEVVRTSGSPRVPSEIQGTMQPPADKPGARKLAIAGPVSSPVQTRLCYLSAGASLTCCLGSVNLSSLDGKQHLLDTFMSHSVVASDHRPSQLSYQDAEGDWMLLHDGEDWPLIAASATSVLLTTNKASPL